MSCSSQHPFMPVISVIFRITVWTCFIIHVYAPVLSRNQTQNFPFMMQILSMCLPRDLLPRRFKARVAAPLLSVTCDTAGQFWGYLGLQLCIWWSGHKYRSVLIVICQPIFKLLNIISFWKFHPLTVLNTTIRSEAAVGEGGGSPPDTRQNHLDGRRSVKTTVSRPHSKPNTSKLLRVEPGVVTFLGAPPTLVFPTCSQAENRCAEESSHFAFKTPGLEICVCSNLCCDLG